MRMRRRQRLLGVLAVVVLVAASLILAALDPKFGDPCEGQEVVAEVTREYVMAVIAEHRERFWEYPNVHGFGPINIRDRHGNRTGRQGIQIYVTSRVPNSQLPEHLRIPNCLEGVPIEWLVEPEHRFTEDYD